MLIDSKLILYLEDLSNLKLSDSEKSRMIEDLQKILNVIEPIKKINTDGVPECSHPSEKVNIFRNDEVKPSFARDLILKNAPVKNDEMFIVPKTVE